MAASLPQSGMGLVEYTGRWRCCYSRDVDITEDYTRYVELSRLTIRNERSVNLFRANKALGNGLLFGYQGWQTSWVA